MCLYVPDEKNKIRKIAQIHTQVLFISSCIITLNKRDPMCFGNVSFELHIVAQIKWKICQSYPPSSSPFALKQLRVERLDDTGDFDTAHTISGHRHLLSASFWTLKKGSKSDAGLQGAHQGDKMMPVCSNCCITLLVKSLDGKSKQTANINMKKKPFKMQKPEIISLNICAYYNIDIL